VAALSNTARGRARRHFNSALPFLFEQLVAVVTTSKATELLFVVTNQAISALLIIQKSCYSLRAILIGEPLCMIARLNGAFPFPL
jgi:hypothetical protein